MIVINELQSIDGMDEETAETLRKAGIKTVDTLAATSLARLVAIGITESMANKILFEAYNNSMFNFKEKDALIQQFEDRQHLTSGTQGLDEILGGKGFESQKVYELYGPEGAGKSTLLHQLICTASLPTTNGGLGAGSIYIDTEGTFSIRKVQQIASWSELTPWRLRGRWFG